MVRRMSNKWWPSRNRVKKFNCNSSVACVQCTKIKPAIAVDNKKKHVALEIFLWQTTDNVVPVFISKHHSPHDVFGLFYDSVNKREEENKTCKVYKVQK